MRNDAERLLTAMPPGFSPDDARAIAETQFGVIGAARLLTAERDQNFRISTDDAEYVLKISHPAEEAATIDCQSAVLDHIAAMDATLAVPRVIRSLDNALHGSAADTDGERYLVRLYSFLPGTLVHAVTPGPDLLYDLGRSAARLDRALKSFEGPRDEVELLWHFSSLGRVRKLVAQIADRETAARVTRALDGYDRHVVPREAELDRSLIHHDLNPHNVLTGDGKVSGILDFGDMSEAPRVTELAIAACYHLGIGSEGIEGVTHCVAGYNSVFPLGDLAVSLLPDFIAARCAMTVAITDWRAREYPENAVYILRNNPVARAGLELLENFGRDRLGEIFAASCQEQT